MRAWPLAVLSVLLLGATAPAPPLSRAEAVGDLRRLHAALRELHPGIYRYSTRAEIGAAFAACESRLPDQVTAREFFLEVASLSTVIRDGHTRFRPSLALDDEAAAWPLLPLRVQVDRARLDVLADCRPAGRRRLAGRGIVSVDGVAAADLIERSAALRSRDGANATYPRWALDQGLAFNDALNLLLGPRDEHRVALATGSETETLVLRSAHRDALGSCVSPAPERAAALRFEDGGRIAVLSLPSLAPELGKDYRAWFGTLEKRGARGLLIDLRDNGGGLDHNGSRLFAHLVRSPFAYYDAIVVNTLRPAPPFDGFAELLLPWRIEPDRSGRLQFTGHECLGPQAPEAPSFDGPVIVLVNGGTFSAASEFAAVAAAHRRALFAGEEVGGAANGNTAGVSAPLVLPHSGIRVQVPMMRYEVAAAGLEAGRGVRPDIEVGVTVGDRLAGRDRAFEQALASMRRSIQEEKQ